MTNIIGMKVKKSLIFQFRRGGVVGVYLVNFSIFEGVLFIDIPCIVHVLFCGGVFFLFEKTPKIDGRKSNKGQEQGDTTCFIIKATQTPIIDEPCSQISADMRNSVWVFRRFACSFSMLSFRIFFKFQNYTLKFGLEIQFLKLSGKSNNIV